jgi:hypothetical protein
MVRTGLSAALDGSAVEVAGVAGAVAVVAGEPDATGEVEAVPGCGDPLSELPVVQPTGSKASARMRARTRRGEVTIRRSA